MILSTLNQLPGKTVAEHFGLVFGSSVRSKHIGRDMFADLKSIFGGEIRGYTELMNETRDEAIDRLQKQAAAKGANAILGVRFGSSDVAAGAAEIYAYGTAVRLG